jgi:hypothetical protein
MKSFNEKLSLLVEESVSKLSKLIEKRKTKSAFSSSLCLHVEDEFSYNLSGNRYLQEVVLREYGINEIELVDNQGYNYDIWALDREEWFSVVDHLIEKYAL